MDKNRIYVANKDTMVYNSNGVCLINKGDRVLIKTPLPKEWERDQFITFWILNKGTGQIGT